MGDLRSHQHALIEAVMCSSEKLRHRGVHLTRGGPGLAGRPGMDELGEGCDRACDAVLDAEKAVLAAPVVTVADVRRKLEAAELQVEGDDCEATCIRSAIEGLRALTGAAPMA